MANAAQIESDFKGDNLSVRMLDVVGDGKFVLDAAISNGSHTLSSATANFKVDDVGKYIEVAGAGAAGALLASTILTHISSSTVLLGAAASTSVTGAWCVFGTDNGSAFQSAVDRITGDPEVGLYIPHGFFLHRGILIGDAARLFGRGNANTVLYNIGSVSSVRILGTDANNFIGMGVDENFCGVEIADLRLLTHPSRSIHGVEMAFVSRFKFTNVFIDQHGLDGVNGGCCFLGSFSNCHINKNRRDGYRFSKALHNSGGVEDQNNITIIDGSCVGNFGVGVHHYGGSSNVLRGVDLEANHSEAVLLEGTFAYTIDTCYMENNGRETNSATIRTKDLSGNPGIALQIIGGNRIAGSGNQNGVANPYTGTPADTIGIDLDYMYNAYITGGEHRNSYAGWLTIGSNSIGTKVGTVFVSAESSQLIDNSNTALMSWHNFQNEPEIRAKQLRFEIQDLADFRSSYIQLIARSYGNNPATMALTAAAQQQSAILFQSSPILSAVIAGGHITSWTIVDPGWRIAAGVIITIYGDGTGATATGTVVGGRLNSVTVTNSGQDYTYAVAVVSSENAYLMGRQIIGASPAADDVGWILYDSYNAWDLIEILLNGNLVFTPTNGHVLIGTHSDTGQLLQVNGTSKFYSDMTLAGLAGGGTQFLKFDNNGKLIAGGSSAGGVTSLNGLTGALSIAAGNRIAVTPSGSNITVAFTDPGAFSTYTPTVTGGGSMTTSGVTALGRYFQLGKIIFLSLDIAVTFGGTASNRVDFSLPVTSKSGISQEVHSLAIASGFTNLQGLPNAGTLEVYSAANYALSTAYTFRCQGFYEAN